MESGDHVSTVTVYPSCWHNVGLHPGVKNEASPNSDFAVLVKKVVADFGGSP